MVNVITIGNQEYTFKCSALLPIIYRNEFHSEFFSDIQKTETDMSISSNLAYAMYKHGNPEELIPYEEWLESFDIMAIVNVIPQLIEMITADSTTISTAKKKNVR